MEKETICKCPCCDGDIVENSKSYYCTNWQNGCDFSVWKNIRGMVVTVDDIIDLCTRGSTFAKDLINKSGRSYEGFLVLTDFDRKKCGKIVATKSAKER